MNTVLLILIIILVIPSTIGLLYRMRLDEAQIRARLASEARHRKQKTQAVLERRTETVTETVRIELVPNEELSLGLTNLIGSIDNNTDATNHHAQVIETTAQIIPLSHVVPQNQIEKPENFTVEDESVGESVNSPYSIRQSPSLEEVKNGEVDDDICAQRKDGKTVQMIADDYGVSKSAIEKRITVLKRDGKL